MTIHIILYRSIGNYALILWKIIKHDLIPFLVVFAVVLFVFAGGLYLERRMEMSDALSIQNNTEADMNISLPQQM